ncbi:hypothetical protein Pfo_012169 [Paulownia fortunei]|nr:hypothetical protein Pfo_012169 [Paulownia fortunei]
MGSTENNKTKSVAGEAGYVLEDVPHLTDYIPHLPAYPNPLRDNPSDTVVKQYFVNEDDSITQKIVVHKSSPGRTHFRRAGPRKRFSLVYFESDEVLACVVTCGGLCPGINTVIRELVCGLHYLYGVSSVLGIEGGYKGFYSKNTITLTPKVVDDIHKHGGIDSIQDRGINQVCIIGDGTQKGAALIFEEIRRRGLKVVVAGIHKTIDNDIPVIDKSFGFDTSVEEAQRAINAAHAEAESFENGVGVVKLMGRYSGFIAMYATLASRDVDFCLIPESPFYLEGPGAGQELLTENMHTMNQEDASGNKLLQDVGLWITQKIKDHFTNQLKMVINLKYIDPTYMIRAIPSIASDNIYCTLLAHSAIHGAMAGYTGFVVGPVNGRHAYIPFHRIN